MKLAVFGWGLGLGQKENRSDLLRFESGKSKDGYQSSGEAVGTPRREK